MRIPVIVATSLVITLVFVSAGISQEEKPPDYSKKSLAEWIKALKDEKNAEGRMEASEALGPNGPYVKVVIPALIEALKDIEWPNTWDAAGALASYGPPVVPILILSLKRPEIGVRVGVVEALSAIRPNSTKAIPPLIAALKDPVPIVRAEAALSLANIGRKAHEAVPALIPLLQEKDDRTREIAASAMGKTGRNSKAAAHALVLALKDDAQEVRRSAAMALERIGPEAKEEVPALIEALQNGTFRQSVATALGSIGPGAKNAVPALIARARRQYSEDREDAIRALGKIGPDARDAVPYLIRALENRENYRLATIAEALGGIGPDAKDAVPALVAAAQDLNEKVSARQVAASAIVKIDPQLAIKLDIETACLNVRLGKVPTIRLSPRAALTEEQKKGIKELIKKLSEVETTDFGISFDFYDRIYFTPLPHLSSSEHWPRGRYEGKPPEALKSLVEMGPVALSFLLDSLEDKTPTKLKLEPLVGWMFFAEELDGNPLNPIERRVLSKSKTRVQDEDDKDSLKSYQIKVGDVCFVAVGQIVGRTYHAIHGWGLGSPGGYTINSPIQSKQMRDQVRAIWSSQDPAKKLLDSLLLDYATEGKFNGKSLDGWQEGSNLQVEAAMRLLYFFPKETAPLIVSRLRSFDVEAADANDHIKREVKNGVRTVEFIKAVSWCHEPEIQKALDDIAKGTDDTEIKKALKK